MSSEKKCPTTLDLIPGNSLGSSVRHETNSSIEKGKVCYSVFD